MDRWGKDSVPVHGGEATPDSTASAPAASVRPWLLCSWEAAGFLYLLTCLAAIAVGLWPQSLVPSKTTSADPAPLPILKTLLEGQLLYFLLVYPIIVLGRSLKGAPQHGLAMMVECSVMLVASAPFYLAAGFLADAVVVDVLRCVVTLWTYLIVTWGACLLLHRPAARPAVLLLLLLVAIGLPAAFYFSAELLPQAWTDVLYNLCPATFAWSAAASRIDDVLPSPLWPLFIWLALGFALGAINWLGKKR